MKLPQGMGYGWWHFAKPFLHDLTFTLQIQGDASQLPGRYFQLYQGKIANVAFYLGFQTDLFRPRAGWQGHGLLFSRWETRDPEDARVAPHGWVESSGREGNFLGVRAIYLWAPGEYKCELTPVDVDHCGTWYEFKVTSKRNKTVSAGCLRFPNEGIETGGCSWTEVYSGISSERDVPFTEMRVRVVANAGGVHPIRCDTMYNSNFRLSDAFIDCGQLVLRSGTGVQRLHSSAQYTIDV